MLNLQNFANIDPHYICVLLELT